MTEIQLEEDESKADEPESRSSVTTDDGFNVPVLLSRLRRETSSSSADDEDFGVIESVSSIILFDRSKSIKPPSLEDFNHIMKLG